MEWAQVILQGVIGGTITGAAAYGAIRVELRYLRRDVDELRAFQAWAVKQMMMQGGA